MEKLVSYTLWANFSWHEHISGKCGDDEYLSKMLSHILLGEQAWFQRIHSQPVDKNIFEILPPGERLGMLKRHEAIYRELLNGDLQRVISYTRFNGDHHSSPTSDILLHLCTHGSHHRGQMAAHASKLNKPVINTDYITYCRLKNI